MTNYVVARPDQITVSETWSNTPISGYTYNDYLVLDNHDHGWITGTSSPINFTYLGANLAYGETVLAMQLPYTVYASISHYIYAQHGNWLSGYYWTWDWAGDYTVSANSYTSVYVTGVNDAPTGSLTINGTPTQGQTLTAVNMLVDPDGIVGDFSYQWKADGISIEGATDLTFVLTEAQVGAAISVTAGYVDRGGIEEAVTSSSTTTVTIFTDPVCFLAGTLIATAAGERPIELLAIGDVITLAGGGQKPVKWIGRMTVSLNRFNRHSASPILIRAGALGDGFPKRDMYTSYRHGFAVNGVLVIAGLLVNGTSIIQCSDWKESVVTFYQVEVEGHELLVAEGAASETFGEVGDNRELFDNAGEFHALYPDAVVAEPMLMGRVIVSRQIPRAVKARIEAAAFEMGYATWAAVA